jgi:WD40 repeat protein
MPGYPDDVAVDTAGTRVAVALDEGPVMLARVGSPEIQTIGQDPSGSIAAAVSPDGRLVASGGRGAGVRVWTDGKDPRTLGSMDGPVFAVTFSPDGAYVAAAGADKTVRVYAVDGSEPPRILRGHADTVGAVAFTADGDRLVSGGFDGLRVWDWRRGVTLLARDAPQGVVKVSAFGADPRIVHYGFDHNVTVTDCDVCGPIADVERLVDDRTSRDLTPEERSAFQVDGS